MLSAACEAQGLRSASVARLPLGAQGFWLELAVDVCCCGMGIVGSGGGGTCGAGGGVHPGGGVHWTKDKDCGALDGV